MFPAPEFLTAEMDYRRERLIAARPPRRPRRHRRARHGGARTLLSGRRLATP
jgi:hypothetical protein